MTCARLYGMCSKTSAGRRGPEDERYGWKDTDLWAKSARASAELAPLLRSVARWARRARSWPSRRGVEDDAKREAGGSEPAGSRTLRRTVPFRVVVLALGTLHCRASSESGRA